MAATLKMKADSDAYLAQVQTIVADDAAAGARRKKQDDFAAIEAKAKNFEA